jgi:hypothetical protein
MILIGTECEKQNRKVVGPLWIVSYEAVSRVKRSLDGRAFTIVLKNGKKISVQTMGYAPCHGRKKLLVSRR